MTIDEQMEINYKYGVSYITNLEIQKLSKEEYEEMIKKILKSIEVTNKEDV